MGFLRQSLLSPLRYVITCNSPMNCLSCSLQASHFFHKYLCLLMNFSLWLYLAWLGRPPHTWYILQPNFPHVKVLPSSRCPTNNIIITTQCCFSPISGPTTYPKNNLSYVKLQGSMKTALESDLPSFEADFVDAGSWVQEEHLPSGDICVKAESFALLRWVI